MKINGSCHCGKITYSAKIDRDAVYLCHCTECQSISGSPFRWAVPVAEDNFNLLSGHPKTYIKKVSEDGIESHQLFCPDCASPLMRPTLIQAQKHSTSAWERPCKEIC